MQGQALVDLVPGFRVYGGGVRIAELADRVGVPTSTVRYYERAGLLDPPARTAAGYRDYDEVAATRLLFVLRTRNMGLSCAQISELLPIWDGTNCVGAHERVSQLIADKQTEIAERIAELQSLSDQLDGVRATLEASPAPAACRTDLTCCVPESGADGPIHVDLIPSRRLT